MNIRNLITVKDTKLFTANFGWIREPEMWLRLQKELDPALSQAASGLHWIL